MHLYSPTIIHVKIVSSWMDRNRGLAIAIGEVVDDAIIDVENIFRRLRENQLAAAPRPLFNVILDASLEVRTAVVFATFVVALVFVITFLRPGQPGANSHGAPPPGPLQVSRPSAGPVDRGSLVWAGVSILGCAAIGLAIQTTTDSIRADRESRYAFR